MVDVFDTIPEWQQGLIHESFEYIAAIKNAPPPQPPPPPTASAGLSSLVEESGDEVEIPF
jgi:hypothetical protein